MTISQSLLLFTSCLAAMALPGPGIAAVTARAATLGAAACAPFIFGMVLGDLVLFAAAAAGLSALAAVWAPLRPAFAAAAGFWLLTLAWGQMRRADQIPHPAASGSSSAGAGAAAGFLLTMANPKTIIFYMALLPAILGTKPVGWIQCLISAAIIAATLCAVMTGYAWAAAAAARILQNPRPLRLIAAAIMGLLGAVLLIDAAAAFAVKRITS